MQAAKINKFKKNSNFIRFSKIYSDLIKTKHVLNFFNGGLKKHQLIKIYKIISGRTLFLDFLTRLEYRLDYVLLKVGFALTGKQVKQMLLHKQVMINFLPVKSASISIKKLDLISLNSIFILKYKTRLICQLFKTVFFFNFLKKKKLRKKLTIQNVFIYFKFPIFVEINFKIFTFLVVKKPLLQEFFFPKVISLYDCNQLHFIL